MKYSIKSYQMMFDNLLSQELYFIASYASEHNIKCAMKRVLGHAIKSGLIRSYSGLVVSETLDVYFTIVEGDNESVNLILYYGQ